MFYSCHSHFLLLYNLMKQRWIDERRLQHLREAFGLSTHFLKSSNSSWRESLSVFYQRFSKHSTLLDMLHFKHTLNVKKTWRVCPKINILSVFIHCHVILNLHHMYECFSEFLLSWKKIQWWVNDNLFFLLIWSVSLNICNGTLNQP